MSMSANPFVSRLCRGGALDAEACAFLEQMTRHRTPHHAKADEPDFHQIVTLVLWCSGARVLRFRFTGSWVHEFPGSWVRGFANR